MCIAGNPSTCPDSDEDEYECFHQTLKFSYNSHIDDCDEIMTLGLAVASYLPVTNDFDETVMCGTYMFHGRIIDDFSILKIDSTTAYIHESTMSTGLMIWRMILGAHTSLYSGQVEGMFGLFNSSIDTGIITANSSGSNCDH